MSEVLSTKMARPGAEARYVAISSAGRAPALVSEGAAEAVAQSAAGMAGEYAGAGESSVCEERARRTSLGALGRRASWERNAVPTPPTPVRQLSITIRGGLGLETKMEGYRTDDTEIDGGGHYEAIR